MSNIGVSVVIPTLNRDDYLYNSICDILKQDYSLFEVIVVDQSSVINTEIELLINKNKNKNKLRYYSVSFKGLPQARNFGWQNALYPIILYIDDDVRIEQGFITAHASGYVDDGIGIVGGRVLEIGMGGKESVGSFNPWTATPRGEFACTTSKFVDHVKGCNFSCRKSLLNSLNGFDEQLTVGASLYEELELMLRVKPCKMKVFYKADAVLKHLASSEGGCRVNDDIPKYVYGLAHNKCLVITRHLLWYHKVSSYFRLWLLSLSYSVSMKSLRPLYSCFKGFIKGYISGKSVVVCGNYREEV